MKKVLILLLFFVQAGLFFILPALGTRVFLSPDETAVAVSARAFATQGTMQILDPILRDGPWLHPRSFVSQVSQEASFMVPVGFLGLPAILSVGWWVFGELALMLFTPLLVISAGYAMWHLCKNFGRLSQIAAVSVWFSFPTVILYANRGLFPNLPVACLMIWCVFFLIGWIPSSQRLQRLMIVLAGMWCGLALSIRPVEAVWMVSWVLVAWLLRRSTKPPQIGFGWFLLGLLPGVLLLAVANIQTYESLFAVGYFLRDPVEIASNATNLVVRSWPFGFHPRAIWFNLHAYIFTFLAPWTVLCLAATARYLRNRRAWLVLLGAAWTLVVLVLMYGQAIYQDHVGINVVSMGNSYLRYLIPLAPICALAGAALAQSLRDRFSLRRTRLFVVSGLVLLVSLGTWTALDHDAEGVLPSSHELTRYAAIRQSTIEQLGPRAIILSERSDKIFFPTFRVASPLPSFERIQELVLGAPVPVAFFGSTLHEAALIPWHEAGLELRPLFQTQNQVLYLISSTSTSSIP